MSSTVSFTGSGFFVERATQIAPATVRVRYTQFPLAISPSGSYDALNKANYVISGPSINTITNVGAVYGDPQSYDLFLAAALGSGTYTVTVSNVVREDNGSPLLDPMFATFTVSIINPQVSPSNGAEDDDEEQLIRKFLNPALKGEAWNALIAAYAYGDHVNNENLAKAFDQLFVSRASGLYLNRLGADDGVQRPINVGIPDKLFRDYIIKTTAEKLTENSLLDILEIFYGPDSVRAFDISAESEPFFIQQGDDLTIVFDGQKTIKTVFDQTDFAIMGAAKAIEIAMALNRSFEINSSSAFASTYTDPENGSVKVKIYSSSLGLGSSVQVTGGKAQNVLKFSSELPILGPYYLAGSGNALPTWTVDFNTATKISRFTVTDFGTAKNPDLSKLEIGDYVNIYGNGFDPDNRGSFSVKNVYFSVDLSGTNIIEWFEVANDLGVSQGSVDQVLDTDILYFKPVKKNTLGNGHRSVIVTQPGDGNVDVILPATSEAVGRHKYTGAYGQVNAPIEIIELERIDGVVTVEATNHGLLPGSQIFVDGVYGELTIPPITAGNLTDTSDSSIGSIWSDLAPAPDQGPVYGVTALTTSGIALISGGFVYNSGTPNTNAANNGFVINSVTNTSGKKVVDYDFNGYSGSTPLSLAYVAFSVGPYNKATTQNKIVSTGGWGGGPIAFSTSLWDPETGDWTTGSPYPDMNHERAIHQQSNLSDGNILVSGGVGQLQNTAIKTAETWDPDGISGWQDTTGTMKVARADHQQITLQNGKVLAVGGRTLAKGFEVISDTVAYWAMDDSGATEADLGPNNLTLTVTNATSIPGGEIKNARALSPSLSNSYLNRASYDASLGNTFTSGNFTVEGFFFHDTGYKGPIIVFGSTPAGTLATNTLFGFGYSSTDFWIWYHTGSNVLTSLSVPIGSNLRTLYNHYAVTSSNNAGTCTFKLYINGILIHTFTGPVATGGTSSFLRFGSDIATSIVAVGNHYNSGVIDDTRISNTTHDADTIFKNYQSAVGEFLFTDTDRIGNILNSCEIYDPDTDTWALTGAMANARFQHKLVLLPNGYVLAIGGLGMNPSQGTTDGLPQSVYDIEMYDPNTGFWTVVSKLIYARDNLIAEYISSKEQVLIAGGPATVKTELLDTKTFRIKESSAVLPAIRTFAQSAVMQGDCVLLAAGYDADTGNTAQDYFLYIPNADSFLSGGLNGEFSVKRVIDANHFTYETPENTTYTLNGSATATITTFRAAANPDLPGPFVFEPYSGVGVTATASVLTENYFANQQYGVLNVLSTDGFPENGGWLVLDFGYKNQIAPIKYLGKISETELAIDFSLFPTNINRGEQVSIVAGGTTGSTTITISPLSQNVLPGTPLKLTGGTDLIEFAYVAQTAYAGDTTLVLSSPIEDGVRTAAFICVSTVTVLTGKGSYNPPNSIDFGSLWLTDSPSGRAAAQTGVQNSSAAGVNVNITVVYPGDFGLGNQGYPTENNYKKSDVVEIFSENYEGLDE